MGEGVRTLRNFRAPCPSVDNHSDGKISILSDFDINNYLLIFGLYSVC